MFRARRWISGVLVIGSVAVTVPEVADAGHHQRPDYVIVNPALDPIDVGGKPSIVKQGTLRGAGYIIEVPPKWNGELVMWAHGYRGNDPTLTVDPPDYGLREHFLELGFAWAASSYDSNGYDIESGVQSTRRLVAEFGHLVGRPRRTYLVGQSMGGHVTARSIEQYPTVYDGAMPTCGVLGDVKLFDFFTDFTFTSQALAGVDSYPIPPDYATAVVPGIQDALGTTDMGFGDPANELGLQFRSIVIKQSGGPRPGADSAFAYWKDFLFTLPTADDGGSLAFNPGRVGTNVGTKYTPNTPADVNSIVRRVPAQDRTARRSRVLSAVALVEGTPRVPVLTLHDIGDLFVPFSMEQYYAQDVAAHHRSGLLVQRAVRALGHCEFSPLEASTAFDDLVAWVEHGVRPAGDNVTDATAVADPDFGCRFSEPDPADPGSRFAFPACHTAGG